VLFEPCDAVDACVAEVAKGFLGDYALHLERQIAKHLIRVVGHPGFTLDVRAAAGVVHTAADRGCPASMKTIENQDSRPVRARLERRAGPSAAKADDYDIGFVIPFFSVGFAEDQRRFGRIRGQRVLPFWHREEIEHVSLRLSRRFQSGLKP